MGLSLDIAKIVAAGLPALAWLSWAGTTSPAILLVSPVLLFIFFGTKRKQKQAVPRREAKCAPCPGYRDPLRWSFLPRAGWPNTGVFKANQPQVCFHENDYMSCKGVAIHQPTHEPELKSTGAYPYSWHLAGRKRLWEIRLQIRFKKIPQSHLYFGLELGGYVPVSGIAKRVQTALVNAIRVIVGNDFYHSSGDDPSRVKAECEPPTFVMPLWAFDQFAVSEVGEEPDITGDLANVGIRRTDGLPAYAKAMNATVASLSTDKVYTFSFWGISQFLDCMAWEVNFWGLKLDFNRLCGAAPVYVAMYELSETEDERRHLVSRKNYIWKVAMWSEDKPPADGALEKLLGAKALLDDRTMKEDKSGGDATGASFFGCCTGRPDKKTF